MSAGGDEGSIHLGGGPARKCPQCGLDFTGETHADCPAEGATIKKTSVPPDANRPPSSKSGLIDEIPAEAAPHQNDPSRLLNQYILVKQIGKGGMGAVWKAWDRKLTRWIAVKFLLASEEEDVARFQREAKLAARLRHPNIAPIYEVGEVPSTQAGSAARYFLAMEYIDGQSLSSALGLPQGQLLDIFVKVAQGVEAAHKAGVVHRDLKPQNVMLTSEHWPYVMDFGLAKALQAESSLSVSGAVMGTPSFMPPEQAQGKLDQVDAQSDVYSLGATMYAVFCKKLPFAGQTPIEVLMKVCQEEPVRPRQVVAELPEDVERIILKAMAKAKADRYASAGALADDLKRFLANLPIEAQGPSSLKLAARGMKRNAWPLAAGALLLLAAGALAFVFLKKPDPPAPPAPAPPVAVADASAEETRRKTEEADRLARETLQRKWQDEWYTLRPKLDVDRWDPKDAALPAAANALLRRMKVEAARSDQANVDDTFADYARGAGEAASRLDRADRAKAARLVAWADMIAGALKDVDALRGHADAAGKARTAALAVAQFKGTVTLQLAPAPWAEVARILRDGQPIELPGRFTPLRVPGLEIGALEIELVHPQHGKKTVRLDAARLKDQKTYTVSGRMQGTAFEIEEK